VKNSKGSEVTVEGIMQKIREEVETKRTVSADTPSPQKTKVEIRNPRAAGLLGDTSFSGMSDRGMLWQYGTKYAHVIKKNPIVNKIAEKCYWYLAGK